MPPHQPASRPRRSPARIGQPPTPPPAGDADPAARFTPEQLHILHQVYQLILAHARPEATP